VASNPTVPDTEGSNWCCNEHVRKIQAINWPLNQPDGIEAKYWEQQFRGMLQSYTAAATQVDHLRAAICAFFEFDENPGDSELICQLNWITAKQKRMGNNAK
jgi:hypothetical protein